ncbi:NAD(+)--dinitrogen-reductase ADP-D-ribosyltransferase [Rhodoferax sp.]|uniref:NAD(+)--dinitrogen-reductase ADP-D-ribosyltransferase n=1 Tax=Rhodoferax sp. TaxID=50421 RepID=UPI0025FEBF4B|nr:NAD(+)--dinitrogen-reductase ADP-D-ribosyltransferase [Rhodoferax sp.]MCM2341708.1 NAD(+)--dinitrogen-reductase ADP-D-ribosyltransferase [Rhodoferax sp.]
MAEDDAPDQHNRWYATNLVGVPAPLLAGTAFNANPVALSIAGTRESHAGLFALLESSHDLSEAHDMFVHYLSIAFGLRKPAPHELIGMGQSEQRRWRSSWRKLLQGWGMDANGAAGAVLKGWVESRFGLVPSFHKAPLARFPSPAWIAYLQEKASSRLNNNNIYQQLDLLFEFCQWALRRIRTQNQAEPVQHLRLWRGSNQCEEQVVTGRLQNRRCTIRLNNLVSFSLSQEDASCFGDWVFEVQVPMCKVLVFPDLLPGQVLQGEQEVLAIGGDYEVMARYE